MSKNLVLLQTRIQQVHRCEAVHRESVHVHEKMDGQTIWKGDVEVFELDGHGEAKKCYAWPCDQAEQNRQFVTILEKPPVDSPAMAVKAAIFFDAQPVRPHRHDLPT